ncbi:hypothetical protein J7643_09535 [bacterium]|nr:hypothetical protein [bacterium]
MRTTKLNRAALVLGVTLLAACHTPSLDRPLVAPGLPGAPPGTEAIAAAPVQGRVDFPERKVLAAASDVGADATVAVIDPGTARTLATGLTDAAGAFSLEMPFSVVTGAYYYLQVSKRVGGVSGNHVSMITVLKWTNTGWASITNPVGGQGTIVISPLTTAVALIDREDPAVSLSQLLGVVSGPTYGAVTPFGTHSAAEVTARAASITSLLQQDLDPLGDRASAAAGLKAPDDVGDETVHHDYKLTKNGVESTFVWIPVFTAYQLINPANCGGSNTTKPVGYWVKDKPLGTENADWAQETFGGFYAGKYEASRADATGTTAGVSGALKVQKGAVPWAMVDWDEASKASMAYDAHCHLMRDEEWTALAVWSMIQGLKVYGNNQSGKDVEDTSITFQDDPTASGIRALTGTGTRGTWSGTTNLTTHTGTTAGVYDLNGNIAEWTATLGGASGNFVVNGVTLPIAAPTGGDSFTAIATDPRLRRYGVAKSVNWVGLALFSNDMFYIEPGVAAAKSYRGGTAENIKGEKYSGIWTVVLESPRNAATARIGFRPALRY